jgi:hypothetical protein
VPQKVNVSEAKRVGLDLNGVACGFASEFVGVHFVLCLFVSSAFRLRWKE